MNKRLSYLFPVVLVLIADQLSKAWATLQLRDSASKAIIPGWLNLDYNENPGIALSIFRDGGTITKWLLVAVSVGAAVFVLSYLLRTPIKDRLLLTALSLLLAGILGNLVDRVWHGYVVDFIFFHCKDAWRFPVFNVADTAISFGAALMAIDLLRTSSKTQATQSPVVIPEP